MTKYNHKTFIMNYKTYDESLNKKETKAATKQILKQIGEFQYLMHAEEKHSLLIILQGLDASGKDSLTRRLLKYCNPVGYSIKSFKVLFECFERSPGRTTERAG